jgi:hypothetical protein
MWYNLGKHEDTREWEFVSITPRRYSIDNMRNMSAEAALINQCDYLFFYDDDVLVPHNALRKMVKTLQDNPMGIVAGLTYVRGYPFEAMAFTDVETGMRHLSHKEIDESEEDLIECDAIGFSCALIDVNILKEIEVPFFITAPQNTEDVYFCIKAKTILPQVKVFLDKSIECEHIVDSYTVSHKNHKLVKRFEEDVFEAKKQTADFDPKVIESARERLSAVDS